MTFKIDQIARDIALRRWVLPECLHVPVAAVNEEAITTYIGDIVQVLAKAIPDKNPLGGFGVPQHNWR